jgi:hypothetical protein
MNQLEILKKLIKATEKSISIMKKSKTPEKVRDGLYKIVTLMSEIPGQEKLIKGLRTAYQFTDFQVMNFRNAILTEFPKNIKLYKQSAKRIKGVMPKIQIPIKKIAACAIIIIIIIFVVAIINWNPSGGLEVKIHVPSSPVTYQWSDDQWTGEPLEYTIEVINHRNEDLFNVTVYDTEGFNWVGDMKAGETKNFSIIYNGSIADSVAVSAYADGWNANGVKISSIRDTFLEMFGGTYNFSYAMGEALISCELKGTGYCSGHAIKFNVKLNVNISIDVKMDRALILENSGYGQNMIVLDQSTFKIEPDIDYEFDIEAYCLDLHRNNPSSSENFTILDETSSYGEDIITFVSYLYDLPESDTTITAVQIAIWVITDDIEENEIPFSYDDSDITKARELLEGAGIDIYGKSLFQ